MALVGHSTSRSSPPTGKDLNPHTQKRQTEVSQQQSSTMTKTGVKEMNFYLYSLCLKLQLEGQIITRGIVLLFH